MFWKEMYGSIKTTFWYREHFFLYTKQKTLFYAECKLGDLNANWIPILSVSIFASYNFTPLVSVPTDCMSKMSSQCIYSTNRMVPLYFLFLYSCNLIAVYISTHTSSFLYNLWIRNNCDVLFLSYFACTILTLVIDTREYFG